MTMVLIVVAERCGECVGCGAETTLIVLLGKGGFYICRKCLAELCEEAKRWLEPT